VKSNFFSFPTQKRFFLQLFHTSTEDEEVNEKKNYVDDDNDNYGNVGRMNHKYESSWFPQLRHNHTNISLCMKSHWILCHKKKIYSI